MILNFVKIVTFYAKIICVRLANLVKNYKSRPRYYKRKIFSTTVLTLNVNPDRWKVNGDVWGTNA